MISHIAIRVLVRFRPFVLSVATKVDLLDRITSEITEPEAAISLLIDTRKSGFACIVLLSAVLGRFNSASIVLFDPDGQPPEQSSGNCCENQQSFSVMRFASGKSQC